MDNILYDVSTLCSVYNTVYNELMLLYDAQVQILLPIM